MDAIVSWAANQFGAEWLILAYLWYQFSFGVVKKLNKTIRSFVPVLLALSTQVDGVAEDDVADQLETDLDTPGQLLTDAAERDIVNDSKPKKCKEGD